MKQSLLFVFTFTLNQLCAQVGFSGYCGKISYIYHAPANGGLNVPSIEYVAVKPGMINTLYVAFQQIPDFVTIYAGNKKMFSGEFGSDCTKGISTTCKVGPLQYFIDTSGRATESFFIIPDNFVFNQSDRFEKQGLVKITIVVPLNVCELRIEILPNSKYSTVMWVYLPCVDSTKIFNAVRRDISVCIGNQFKGRTINADTIFYELGSICENPIEWHVHVLGEVISLFGNPLCEYMRVFIEKTKGYVNVFQDGLSIDSGLIRIPKNTSSNILIIDKDKCRHVWDVSFTTDTRIKDFSLGDTTIRKRVHTMLLPVIPSGLRYEWKPAQGGEYSQSKKYFLIDGKQNDINLPCRIIGTDNCEMIANYEIHRKDEEEIFVPNVFSPNDDGVNDLFRIFTNGQVKNIFHVDIYDRFGERVYQSSDLLQHESWWNGEFRGQKCMNGVYVWVVTYQTVFEPKIYLISGDVTLLR